MSNWIDVKDKAPDLEYPKTRVPCITRVGIKNSKPQSQFHWYCYGDGEYWWEDTDGFVISTSADKTIDDEWVTHWQPMPSTDLD